MPAPGTGPSRPESGCKSVSTSIAEVAGFRASRVSCTSCLVIMIFSLAGVGCRDYRGDGRGIRGLSDSIGQIASADLGDAWILPLRGLVLRGSSEEN